MFQNIQTRDVLAVMTTAAALLFNGIALVSGRDPEVATMTLAGAVIGYYFNKSRDDEVIAARANDDGPLAPPLYGKQD